MNRVTFMAVVTVLGLFGFVVFSSIYNSIQDANSKKELEQQGFLFLDNGLGIEIYSNHEGKVTKRQAAVIAGLNAQITWVDFSGSALEDGVCEGISSILSLEQLNLSGTNVSSKCIKQFRNCKNLRGLDLRRLSITDETMEFITSFQNLRQLSVDLTPISNTGIESLTKLPKLRYLAFAGCEQIDVESLIPILARMKWLEFVVLPDFGFTESEKTEIIAKLASKGIGARFDKEDEIIR